MYGAITANKKKTVLIMVVFFLLAGGLSWLFSYIYQDYSITTIVLIFAVFYAFWSYYGSARLALALNGARQITKKDNPRLWRTIENLTITTGLPMPKVYIIDD